MYNHINKETDINGAMIPELCQSHELVRYAILKDLSCCFPDSAWKPSA